MTGHGTKSLKKVIIDKPGEELLSIAWWNGGGAVKKRLEVNPGIRKFIKSKPDIWTYSESGITKPQSLSLDGYNYFLHRSYLRDKLKCR